MDTACKLEDLQILLRTSIEHAQSRVESSPSTRRVFQRVLALLWSAHDEIEALERTGKEQSSISRE